MPDIKVQKMPPVSGTPGTHANSSPADIYDAEEVKIEKLFGKITKSLVPFYFWYAHNEKGSITQIKLFTCKWFETVTLISK